MSRQSTFKRFLGYLVDYKLAFFLAVIGMVGYSALDAFVLSQLQPLIDDGFSDAGRDYLRAAALFIIPIFILRGLFNFLGTYTLSWISTQVVMKMRQQLFNHFVHMPVSFHDSQSTGALISKVTFDIENVANASSKALLLIVREGAFIIGLLAVMFYHSWQLSAIFLVIGPIIALIVSVVTKRFRIVSRSIQQAMGSLTTSLEQVLKGHKVVLMFGGQDKEKERFAKVNNDNRQQNMKLVVARTMSVSTVQVIASMALAVVLYMASMPDYMESLTAGAFTAVLSAMAMLLRPLKQLTTVNETFQRGMAACKSVFEVLDQATENDTGTLDVERVKGQIDFKNVSFTYPAKEVKTLKGISFSVAAGETIALVGRSGSGKSTISSLLTRFYNIDAGELTIDGHNIDDFTLLSLRNQFALVSQNVTLFNDTIANNIAYGSDESSLEAIQQAAKVAHVLEFANSLESGLDTIIGEDGVSLSGGQRQRIAIARALLRNSPILILDEATSALDTESERLIQDALVKLQKNRTSIVIAHRLSTIESSDKILVIDDGNIVEQGNHAELLAEQGLYYQLHQLQQGGE